MSYTGDQLPKKRKLDKNGNLIDPEDTLMDDLLSMFSIKRPDINCFNCKHLNEDMISCKAFSNVIPQVILTGDFQHDEPFKDDGGVMFEPKEEED